MGAWDEILKGTKGDDIIYGGSGDDYLQGRAGDDVLDGGDGNDQIHGDADDDYLIGGRGDDFLHGGIGGVDTAVYFGSIFEYSHYWEGGNFVVSHLGGSGIDGTDRLLHIERLIFADAVIDLTQNNAPIAFDDVASTNEDVGTYSSGSASVLDNDFDWEGSALSVAAGSFTGSYGTLAMNSDGTYTYTPFASTQALAQGQSVVDSFSYTVSDGSLTDTGTLSIAIAGVNDAPVASSDSASGHENQLLSIDVLANDTDVDNGAVLTLVAASGPAGKGSVSIVGNQVQFDPGSDFDHLAVGDSEIVVLSYTVQDEHGASSSSTVAVTVTGTNDGPVASPDTASGHENQVLTVDVLANDTDVDDNAVLTIVAASAPKGSASIVGNQVEFDPGTDFDHLADGASEIVVVSYTIEDEHGASSSSTLTITVTGTNDGPVANADSATTSENAATLIDVLANDTDADDGAALTVMSASAPAGQGSASVVGNQVEFDPGADFDYLAVGESVDVVLDYSIEDEHGASSSSTVTVTVTGTNDAPTIDAGGTDAAGSVTELPNDAAGENVTVHSDSGSIAFDDLDLSDTHSATATAQGGSYLGTFTLDPVDQSGNSVGWDFSVSDADLDALEEGQVVTQTYTVQIDDGNGGTVSQDVTVTITGAADGPPSWYIDNSAAGSANLGTQADPYTSIAAFNAAQGTPGGPDVGQTVYLLTGTGTYAEADGINLLDDQVLIGVDTGLGRPTIVATAGDGINVAQNNSVSDIDIGSTSGAGIADSGGSVGTLTVSDVAVSGSGRIVDIDQGGTINVTLDSAASTASSGGAIDLNGLTGSFTVTGSTTIGGVHSGGGVDVTGSTNLNVAFQGTLSVVTGSATAVNYTGNSGGGLTIGGVANTIATTSAIAVNLGSASNVSIGNATISSTGNYAILGSNLNGFQLGDSVVTGAAGADATIAFTNLTGTAELLGNTIGGGGGDNLRIVNSSGTLDLTIADSAGNQATVGLNHAANGDDGAYIETNGTAALALTIEGVDFLGASSDMLHVHALGSSTQDVEIRDSTFHNVHTNIAPAGGGVILSGSGTGVTVDYLIEGSSFRGADGTALSATYGGGTIRGRIEGNVIGNGDGVEGTEGSSGGGAGIFIDLEKSSAGTATYSVAIVDNEVYDVGIAGMFISVSDSAGGSPAVLEALISGNTIEEMSDFSFAALYAVVGGAGPGDASELGLDLHDNVIDASGADYGSNAVVLDQVSEDAHYNLPGYAGSPDGEFTANPGMASVDIDAFWAGQGNVMTNGAFAFQPGGVDASFVSGVSGDPFVLPVWVA